MEFHFSGNASSAQGGEQLYDIPAFGNVSLLHYTDCHAQLLPIYYREPGINLGVGDSEGKVPHLVGASFLNRFEFKRGSSQAYAFSHLDFCVGARD